MKFFLDIAAVRSEDLIRAMKIKSNSIDHEKRSTIKSIFLQERPAYLNIGSLNILVVLRNRKYIRLY